jgi:glutamate-5-semialdehyde dehydrogenase
MSSLVHSPDETDKHLYCRHLATQARSAARHLAVLTTAEKNHWLQLTAERLRRAEEQILQANAEDVDQARAMQLSPAVVDRLLLNHHRLQAMADGMKAVAALPDPVGQVIEGHVRPNGLEIRKVRVPLGVLFFIYESRPNVTTDAAALAIKSGNAIILRGGKEALASNRAIFTVLRETLTEVGLPGEAITLLTDTDRQLVTELLKLGDLVDLTIPRGGESLIREVAAHATMPVLKHYRGNCHIYVDCAADLQAAYPIILNAKCQRPGTCNALESLLVHEEVADKFLPKLGQLLAEKRVQILGCPQTCRQLPTAQPATEEDYYAEFLDLKISVKVVASLAEAVAHIEHYGSHHTDAILTSDLAAAQEFVRRVDSAAVMVNASTRLHDGQEFGLGAEIGISTDKFHARGPCGLVELTGYKYVVFGSGQLRL